MTQQQTNKALYQQLSNHFGLLEELFSVQTGFFFEGAQRQHNLETLRHMACFADMVLFLSGEKGAGKTHLLKRLQVESADGLGVIYVDCEQVMKMGKLRPEYLLSAALTSLGLSDQKLKLKALFSMVLKACHRRQAAEDVRTLIVFDNADKMPKKELQEYCSLCRDLPAESAMVMLFSGPVNLVQSSKIGTNLGQDDWWHQIQLKPITQDEIHEYLSQALASAGYKGVLELSDQQVQQLSDLGKGFPGRINKLFPSVFLEPGSLKIIKKRTANSMPLGIMMGVAGLLIFSFLFVSYQHGLFDSFLTDNVELVESEQNVASFSAVTEPLDQATKTEKEQSARIAMLDQMMQEQGLRVSELKTEDELVETDDSAKEILPDMESELNVDEDNLPAEVTQDELSEELQEKKVLSEEEKPLMMQDETVEVQPVQTKSNELETVASVSSKSGYFRSKEWLISQNKNAYLPQILGSYSEETALKFIEQVGKQRFDVFYLETQHKGKKWYVVFYGVYPAKSHAQDAVKNAPRIIKDQKPWIRAIAEVLAAYPR